MDERWGSKLSTWIAVSIYGSCCLSFVLLLHANWKGTIFEHQMRQKTWMEQWLIWAMCEGTSGTSRSNRWVRTRRRNYHRAIGKLCGGQNSTRHWTLLAQNRTHLYLSVPCQRIVALQVAEKCRVWRNVLGRVCLWKVSTVLSDFEMGHSTHLRLALYSPWSLGFPWAHRNPITPAFHLHTPQALRDFWLKMAKGEK